MRLEQLFNGLWVGGAIAAIAAYPARAGIPRVTAARLNQTTQGLEVILETTDGREPQTFAFSYGSTLVVDIVGLELAAESLRQDSPIPGMAAIAVTSPDSNSIRIRATGSTEIPTFKVFPSRGKLVFSFVAGSDTPDVAESSPTPRQDRPPGSISEGTEPSLAESPAEPELPTLETETGAEKPTGTILQPPGSAEQPTGTILQPPGSAEQPTGTAPGSEVSEDEDIIKVVVTASRTAQEVTDVPRSVTVIDREKIDEQTILTTGVEDILAWKVPGFGPPTGESSGRSLAQTLRGRSAAILVDGVPQNSNYSLGQELASIDPSTIERIEIVRGPTAIYGDGGTGGAINIITRRPNSDRITSEVEVGLGSSLINSKDSFRNSLRYNLSGRRGIADFVLSVSREDTGDIYDASGDRIPSATSAGQIDAETISILGKLGLDLTDFQRLQFTVDYYNSSIDPDFIADPDTPPGSKARAIPLDLENESSGEGSRNNQFNLSYNHDDLFGSELQTQAYYRNYTLRVLGTTDQIDRIVRQRARGEKWGGRLQVNTPLSSQSATSILWGVDYSRENNEAPFEVFDQEAFEEKRVLRKIEDTTFVPFYEIGSLGLFAQLQWELSDSFALSGGVRNENIDLSIDDYTTDAGKDIEGGELDFNSTLFNIGLTWNVSDTITWFGSFSQGFSLPEFGFLFRRPPRQLNRVEDDLEVTEPKKVNNYEIGVRADWDALQLSLAGFYNTADVGSSFVVNPAGFAEVSRAPERIYGIEATLDWQPSSKWQLGATVSWTEGENDIDDDGEFKALSSLNIQPLKLTAYVENETLPGWNNRLQFLYVGNRDRAFEDEIDPFKIEEYLIVDYIGSLKVGPGQLKLGIQNLLNVQYFPVQSQFIGGLTDTFGSGSANVAGVGRNLKVSYLMKF